MTRKQIYRKSFALWGSAQQMIWMTEECSELIQALQKSDCQHGDRTAIVEGLAGVEIMCEQMRVVFGSTGIDEIKKRKLEQIEKCL